MDLNAIKTELHAAAATAAKDFAIQHFGGTDGGACGFAWVTVYPANKGNTKLGKAERNVLKSLGFRQDWTGKAYQLWDPANWPGQSVDAKSAGAVAAANVLKKHGFRAYAEDRLD